eukprot:13934111-Heterocapsa_arctica.AAC.1
MVTARARPDSYETPKTPNNYFDRNTTTKTPAADGTVLLGWLYADSLSPGSVARCGCEPNSEYLYLIPGIYYYYYRNRNRNRKSTSKSNIDIKHISFRGYRAIGESSRYRHSIPDEKLLCLRKL